MKTVRTKSVTCRRKEAFIKNECYGLHYLFASLKGVDNQLARQRGEELLKRADLLPHQNKRIEELSRGMGQIVQLIITIIHEPDLIILDEPFPVWTRLILNCLKI